MFSLCDSTWYDDAHRYGPTSTLLRLPRGRSNPLRFATYAQYKLNDSAADCFPYGCCVFQITLGPCHSSRQVNVDEYCILFTSFHPQQVSQHKVEPIDTSFLGTGHSRLYQRIYSRDIEHRQSVQQCSASHYNGQPTRISTDDTLTRHPRYYQQHVSRRCFNAK
jgi:hypothetical protein